MKDILALCARAVPDHGTRYAAALACWAGALWSVRPDPLVFVALGLGAASVVEQA